MAFQLWVGAQFCGDTWRLAEGDAEPMLQYLPPIAHRFANGAWLNRFITSFDLIEARLASGDAGELSLTRCTGEEMALHLVIDHAEADYESRVDIFDEQLAELPGRGEADHDFDLMRDVLLLRRRVRPGDPSSSSCSDASSSSSASHSRSDSIGMSR